MGTIAIVLGLGVVFTAWYYSEAATLKRQLRAAKPWPLHELPEDTLGRVIGTAQILGVTMTAPLSGRECVFYEITVTEHHGKSSSRLLTERQGVPFLLVEGHARAIIEPTDAKVVLTQDARASSGTLDPATPTEEAFLNKHGLSSTGWLGFNRSLTYTEAIIEVGERITVLGAGVREADPDAPPADAYRGMPQTRLRLTSSVTFPLVISDDPSTVI